METTRHTLSRNERLTGFNAIDRLFKNRHHSVTAYPIRAVYVVGDLQEGHALVRMMVSAPKRLFKHAVDRNRIKRQLREAFRLHKHLLYEAMASHERESLSIAFIWLSSEHLSSRYVEQQMVRIMHNISERL